MKTLLVLRHAQSPLDSPTGRDFDRVLDDRGRAAARSVGQAMRDGGTAPDLILASPAKRVVETVEAVAEGFGEPLNADFEPRLYNASTADLVEVLCAAPDDSKRLLLVGHNPGLQELVLYLAEPDPDRLREQAAETFPTSALAELELQIDEWSEVREASAQLVRLLNG